MRARDSWSMGLPLLPPASKQAEWIRQHIAALERTASAAPARNPASRLGKTLGSLGVIGLLLFKFKGALLAIFKFKFLASFGSFIAVYWALYGVRFGVGFALSILIHEMGHYIDIKRRGLPADMPVFLPGLGAYVRWQALGVSTSVKAQISLAGPLAGFLAAAFCASMWWDTHDDFWASLAYAGCWLNIMNLIPIWVLDGGQAFAALARLERFAVLVTAVFLWFTFGEGVFFLVALGAGWRLFTKDVPAESDFGVASYFIALLALLGFIMWKVPHRGF